MLEAEKHRARSMAEFIGGQRGFVAAAKAAYDAAPLQTRPSDIVIASYGKCGTTMLQQAFHTLRTRGDMDFDDICRVVPWIEMGPIHGIDLNAPQRAEPRGYKSHSSYASIPTGARYVVSLRDPKDAFLSNFDFMEGWFIDRSAIPLEDYFEGWSQGGGPEGEGYWNHLLSWWHVRNRPDVLLMSYRQMVRDPAGYIQRLAEFAEIPLDAELLALTVDHASRSFMLAHQDRFDEKMMREASERHGGIPAGSESAKVRPEDAARREDRLPPALAERMDRIWRDRITRELGFDDFAALEAAL
jgi:hypothetical protein